MSLSTKQKKFPQRPETLHLFFSFSGNKLHPLSVQAICFPPVLGSDQLDISAMWPGVNTYYHPGVSGNSKRVPNLQCPLWHVGVFCFLGSRLNMDSIWSLGSFLPAASDSWSALSANTSHGDSFDDCTIIAHSDLLQAPNLPTANQ